MVSWGPGTLPVRNPSRVSLRIQDPGSRNVLEFGIQRPCCTHHACFQSLDPHLPSHSCLEFMQDIPLIIFPPSLPPSLFLFSLRLFQAWSTLTGYFEVVINVGGCIAGPWRSLSINFSYAAHSRCVAIACFSFRSGKLTRSSLEGVLKQRPFFLGVFASGFLLSSTGLSWEKIASKKAKFVSWKSPFQTPFKLDCLIFSTPDFAALMGRKAMPRAPSTLPPQCRHKQDADHAFEQTVSRFTRVANIRCCVAAPSLRNLQANV